MFRRIPRNPEDHKFFRQRCRRRPPQDDPDLLQRDPAIWGEVLPRCPVGVKAPHLVRASVFRETPYTVHRSLGVIRCAELPFHQAGQQLRGTSDIGFAIG